MTDAQFEKDVKSGEKGAVLARDICTEQIEAFNVEDIQGGGEGDSLFSTDWVVNLNGRRQNWGVKIRRANKKKYRDVTVEIMNGTWRENQPVTNEDKGDYYQFKNGSVERYLYGWWATEKEEKIGEFFIFDNKRLLKAPRQTWRGDKWIKFPGFDVAINCRRNRPPNGKSWFTAIPLRKIEKRAKLVRYNGEFDCFDYIRPYFYPQKKQRNLSAFQVSK